MNHMPFLGIPPRFIIGFFALFHTSVGSLAIGLAFIVVFAQILGYRKKLGRYDLFAKRTQLFHVCIYNIGTVNAIGFVFVLSGLFPQFWVHIMNNFFWPFVIEEFLFLLLACAARFAVDGGAFAGFEHPVTSAAALVEGSRFALATWLV